MYKELSPEEGSRYPGGAQQEPGTQKVLGVAAAVWSDSFAAPRTAAGQVPLSPGFSRQEYWSGLPFPAPMHEGVK